MCADRFGAFVRGAAADGRLVVQPRMGFGGVDRMRAGLGAVREARAHTVGTVTLDSYTRAGDHRSARETLRAGAELNGYPLVVHGPAAYRSMLDGIGGDAFPVQVRHGSALPYRLFEAMVDAGVDATEGGPVSYCLPYSRVPLAEAVRNWSRCCELLAEQGGTTHLESFGGCMLGQLCPPGLLVALSLLEGLFFRQHGLRSISLSYAQQTHPRQDLEALAALRGLATVHLVGLDWHLVLYTFMGSFPHSAVGSYRLLEDSVRLAVRSGTERLIVKTPAESRRIPTVEENVDALEFAATMAEDERLLQCSGRESSGRESSGRTGVTDARRSPATEPYGPTRTGLREEAERLVEATLALSPDVGTALVRAFARGLLDVPFCLHPDNADRARPMIDHQGLLRWSRAGAMPVAVAADSGTPGAGGGGGGGGGRVSGTVGSQQLLDMLGFNQRRFDREQFADPRLRNPR